MRYGGTVTLDALDLEIGEGDVFESRRLGRSGDELMMR
jgi:hypothetical protein